MKSKGFKVIVGVLVAVIVALGVLAGVKALAPTAEGPGAPGEGQMVSEGSTEGLVYSDSADGYETAAPLGDEEV